MPHAPISISFLTRDCTLGNMIPIPLILLMYRFSFGIGNAPRDTTQRSIPVDGRREVCDYATEWINIHWRPIPWQPYQCRAKSSKPTPRTY
jgi:hypothetical protein